MSVADSSDGAGYEPYDVPPPPSGGPEGWQYKIVRGYFTRRVAVERLVLEQAAFGWALVEVLDINRVRFGRSRQAAEKDVARDGNPYATTSQVGGNARQTVPILAAAVTFSVFAAVLISLTRGRLSPPAIPILAEPIAMVKVATPEPFVAAPVQRPRELDKKIRDEVRRQVDEALRRGDGRIDK